MMIEIEDERLTLENVGNWVEWDTDIGGKIEEGRIKSWNYPYIYVVFNCGDDWEHFMDYTAASVKPEELSFITR